MTQRVGRKPGGDSHAARDQEPDSFRFINGDEFEVTGRSPPGTGWPSSSHRVFDPGQRRDALMPFKEDFRLPPTSGPPTCAAGDRAGMDRGARPRCPSSGARRALRARRCPAGLPTPRLLRGLAVARYYETLGACKQPNHRPNC